MGHAVEICLWDDGRVRHIFLLTSTAGHRLVMIEISVDNSENCIRKTEMSIAAGYHPLPRRDRRSGNIAMDISVVKVCN